MPFNGSGTFSITTSGTPVVTSTVIDSTMFNALCDELATGLSTCITKDGQTTTTSTITIATLAAGTYTPTLTSVSNVDATVAYDAFYIRVGNFVYVTGAMDVDPTAAAGTSTTVGISLPVASNIGAGTDCLGLVVGATVAETGRIDGDAANNRASAIFPAQSASDHGLRFHFSYRVI